MLVVSVKQGERVYVETATGEVIEAVIVSVDRGKVRLGIGAPKSMNIYRAKIAPERVVSKVARHDAKGTGL